MSRLARILLEVVSSNFPFEGSEMFIFIQAFRKGALALVLSALTVAVVAAPINVGLVVAESLSNSHHFLSGSALSQVYSI